MKDKLNSSVNFLKIVSKTYAITLTKVAVFNIIIYLAFIITGVILLVVKDSEVIEAGFFAKFGGYLLNNMIGIILFIVFIIVTPIIIYLTSTQYALNKTITFLVEDKKHNYLDNILDSIFSIYKNVQPDFIKNTADFSREKIVLLSSINNEFSNNKIVSKLSKTVIDKLSLEELGLLDDNISFYDALKNVTKNKLLDFASPSLNKLYVLYGLQLIVLFLLYYL